MAILSGEQALVVTLQSAVALFRANLGTFVPDIYAYESSTAQSAITTWWTNPVNNIVIQEGFTNQKVVGLAWNVLMGTDQEILSRQPIGQRAAMNGGVETQTTAFDSSYMVACLGPNKDLLRWSQMLCKWALLYYRQTVQSQYGLFNQKVSAGPLQPVPDDLRDAVVYQYMRTVTVLAQHMDAWSLLEVPVLSAASVTTVPNFDEEV